MSADRAGTQTLKLLATPIDVQLLRALSERPRSLVDLRREAGSPPPTTTRGHLRSLAEKGAVVRQQDPSFPGSVHFDLTAVGRELWDVARALEAWLRSAPDRPLTLGSRAAQGTIKALVEGWGTNIIRALAARPLSLTELNGLLNGVSYPSLERRLSAMRLTGQVERMPGPGRRTRYTASEWLRRSVAPLAAAARWEGKNAASQAPPIKRLDVEASLLLALPLLHLPRECSGTCKLAVELRSGKGAAMAGVVAEVRAGRIVSSVADVQASADAWVVGSAASWLGAVIEEDADRLEMGGDGGLARTLVGSLRPGLCGNGY